MNQAWILLLKVVYWDKKEGYEDIKRVLLIDINDYIPLAKVAIAILKLCPIVF